MKEIILALVNYFKLPVMDEKGQGLVEYALIIALVSVALVAALQLLAGLTGIAGVFTAIETAFSGAGA